MHTKTKDKLKTRCGKVREGECIKYNGATWIRLNGDGGKPRFANLQTGYVMCLNFNKMVYPLKQTQKAEFKFM